MEGTPLIFNKFHESSSNSNKIRTLIDEYNDALDEWASRDDYEDLYIERRIMKANVMVEYDRLRSRFDDAQMFRLKDKVNRFIRLAADEIMSVEANFSISPYVDNAVKISFRNTDDLSLTIYDNDIEDGETDYEEAFLTFMENRSQRLEYGSLPQMVELLKTKIRI